MPVVTVYPHGGKGGVAPMSNGHRRVPRGDIQGWSEGATRRNTEFLMSVRTDQLTGAGVALTLTLRDCPPTADDWHKLRRAWEKRMVRAGMVRLHWVTEWQRRGVPHLHCALWFPDRYDFVAAIDAWVAVAGAYGAGHRGQHGRISTSSLSSYVVLSQSTQSASAAHSSAVARSTHAVASPVEPASCGSPADAAPRRIAATSSRICAISES